MECQHKFKIIKEFKKRSKNLFGMESEDTCYHLQCEKCGEIISRIARGYNEDEEFSETPNKTEKEEGHEKKE